MSDRAAVCIARSAGFPSFTQAEALCYILDDAVASPVAHRHLSIKQQQLSRSGSITSATPPWHSLSKPDQQEPAVAE